MKNEKDLYFVAVKVFLQDSEGRLLIIKDVYDDGWDIPGGRLRPEDFTTPLADVVGRKMQEEVGEVVKYELGEPAVFIRHERLEVGLNERRRIFAVGYRAKYLGGEIKLGKYIRDYEWVSLETFVPEDYFTGGWLQGVKEFQLKYTKQLL
jgi:ADP-ribose pyrophosphatase YjhB (NUDIX family)